MMLRTLGSLALCAAGLLATPTAFAQARAADATLAAKPAAAPPVAPSPSRAPGAYLGVFADGLDEPTGLALSASGGVLVQQYNGSTESYTTAGVSTGTFAAATGDFSYGLSVAANGDVIVSEGGNQTLSVFDGATGTLQFTTASVANSVFDNVSNAAGDLFGASGSSQQVARFDGATGALVTSAFLQGTLPELAYGITFGPGGDLYVSGFFSDNVLRYDGQTGAFISEFVAPGTLATGGFLAFGPDGDFYVSDRDGSRVNRYDGQTGAFIETYASGNGLDSAEGILFLNGELLVSSRETGQVLRFEGPVPASGGGVTGSLGYGTCPAALPLGRSACRVDASGTFDLDQAQRYTVFLRVQETGRIAKRGEIKPSPTGTASQSIKFSTTAADPASFTLELVAEAGSVAAPSGAATVIGTLAFTKGDAGLRASEGLTVFPNPATDQATLRFAVTGSQAATLAIYDALGREVARPVDGQVSGAVEASFDASALPAGLYVARLVTAQGTETVRLSVVR